MTYGSQLTRRKSKPGARCPCPTPTPTPTPTPSSVKSAPAQRLPRLPVANVSSSILKGRRAGQSVTSAFAVVGRSNDSQSRPLLSALPLTFLATSNKEEAAIARASANSRERASDASERRIRNPRAPGWAHRTKDDGRGRSSVVALGFGSLLGRASWLWFRLMHRFGEKCGLLAVAAASHVLPTRQPAEAPAKPDKPRSHPDRWHRIAIKTKTKTKSVQGTDQLAGRHHKSSLGTTLAEDRCGESDNTARSSSALSLVAFAVFQVLQARQAGRQADLHA
ncbi:hypothetical protein IWZ03DRAFT_360187 [Phyllosticta citriasiana]|uniref:Uncharacterized protein n=1 Tax=Phyllosticta citriasiana TaxID=595635 RepID=A0ABR1KK40_9PEZI